MRVRKWWQFYAYCMLVRIVGRDERKVKGKTIIHRNRSDRLLKKNDSNSRSFARACVSIRPLFLSRMFARWLKNIRLCLSREKEKANQEKTRENRRKRNGENKYTVVFIIIVFRCNTSRKEEKIFECNQEKKNERDRQRERKR